MQPQEILEKATEDTIREVFRKALRKPFLSRGFMHLTAKGVLSGGLGPLTQEEFLCLLENIRGAVEEVDPAWAEQLGDLSPLDTVRQLAADYLA